MQMSRKAHPSALAAISILILVSGSIMSVARASGDPRGLGSAQSTASATFSGRAIGARVKVTLPLPSARTYCDTGELVAAGGNLSASLTAIKDAVVTSGPVTCASQGSDTVATSSSAMASLSAYAGTAAALSCTSVRAESRATCASATGSSTISGLVFAGASVVVTGAANQTVSIPGVATLVINEQVKAAGSVNIQVNALHLTLPTGDELIICGSHSDIAACATPARSATWGAVKMLYR